MFSKFFVVFIREEERRYVDFETGRFGFVYSWSNLDRRNLVFGAFC